MSESRVNPYVASAARNPGWVIIAAWPIPLIASRLSRTPEVTSSGSVVHRALGVVVAGAGLLLAATYVLHFHPSALDSERWSRSPLRRAARAVLKYTYGTYYAIALLALLVWLITWLAGRL
ncbi:MAG: hypothetical protein H7201_00735 [Candidatus Saccharibacteria bacterium]|nr:hypothetical protein [Microbacteriaceae bacterium]